MNKYTKEAQKELLNHDWECHVAEQLNSMKALKGAFMFGACVLVISFPVYVWLKGWV